MKELKGVYQEKGKRYVNINWEQICNDHLEEFPIIRKCFPGTFNICLTADGEYMPPGENQYREMAKKRGRSVGRYEHGNYISPTARIVEINGFKIIAWIYRGGHFRKGFPNNNILELLSEIQLSKTLSLKNGDSIIIDIEELPEGTHGMPAVPPRTPGKTIIK